MVVGVSDILLMYIDYMRSAQAFQEVFNFSPPKQKQSPPAENAAAVAVECRLTTKRRTPKGSYSPRVAVPPWGGGA